ncbi:MAG: MerR family transcriptional regulator [Candidatus Lindowbacteria bacterium]|nr:MerR family transcriptional regulator [Candidatus Lindowbacteria bacterium]
MKIKELAARAGVSRSKIHFYVEKGLLPPPVRINRTMAFYDESFIERIRLISDFQEKAFLPLGRIKRLLDSVQDSGMLKNILVISSQYAGWLANATPARVMSRDEARRGFGFKEQTLDRLEQLGVLTPEVKKGRRIYHTEDVEIMEVLARMGERGFTPARGWPLEALAMYVDAAHQLARKEVAHLFKRILKGLDPQEAHSLFNNTGEDILLSLFLWMRRKAMRKEFAGRVRRMKSGNSVRRRKENQERATTQRQ